VAILVAGLMGLKFQSYAITNTCNLMGGAVFDSCVNEIHGKTKIRKKTIFNRVLER
jgi:hypothetical protein